MEQMKRENHIRSLEENIKQQEMEILRFREREEKLKEKLERMKEKIARKERKTLKIIQRDEKLKRELQAMKERLAQKDRQSKEERKVTNLKTVEMTITVRMKEEVKMDGEIEKQEEKEQQKESVRDESDTVPQEAGPQPQAITESKSEDQVSEAQTQVQADGSESRKAAEEKMKWTGHDSGEAVSIEVENLQVEPAARSSSGSWMLQSVLSSVRSFVQRLRSHFSAVQVQAEKEEEHEEVSPSRPLIPLGAPTGVLTVHLKACRDFRKSALLKKGTWATVRVTIGRMVKYTEQQPYNNPTCFNEWKHFSIQIQQEEVLRVQQSTVMVVELLICDPNSAAPRLMGRDTITLQEILKKSSFGHQFNLRLRHQKVCKLDAELAFTYGSLGYGYSHQIKHPGRTMENLVEKSLFPRCPPNQDQRDPQYNVTTPSTLPQVDIIPSLMQQDTPRGAECRISAGLMDCIQRRGRLLQLHKGLQECTTGEDRVQFLENLILRKSLGTSYPCRKNESSEV
ncbi:uncharacterized protein LOC118815090 [Colossoma macropomum]|uniref:uncharacterized protein LOC118815090 n=1 Tax=Colossoma macropomum TaxID=42526 RepID=UPI001864999F|nr:uncharacterized protein LOC118815090 [Colossoma macropomum]